MLKEASIMLLNNEVRRFANSKNFGEMWEVKDYTIRLMKKGNISFFKCSCPFASVHPQANCLCKHQVAVLLYEMQRVWE